jgi:O-acetylserine/cysteine efflux transporter
MPLSHLALALAVVAVWGTNFVVIRWGLDVFPPLALAALRFSLAAVPAVCFVARPKVRWRSLAAFGLLLGVGQFGLLFIAMRADISPGLASLVVQTQVFFTIALAALLSAERLRAVQGVAFALALAGMAVIAGHLDATVTATGLVLVLTAALCWSGANLVVRAAGRVDALGFVVWSSLFAAPPLWALSALFEDHRTIWHALQTAGPAAWGVVAWQAAANTWFGYGAWNWLLARHSAAAVTPAALLVPVFGMGASALALAEPLPAWKWLAGGLVMAGLALNVWATRRPPAPFASASATL